MCENRTPFLSLNEASDKRAGKVCDLGTVLTRHSLIAWIDDRQIGPGAAVKVALEVSHDATHWHELGSVAVSGQKGYEIRAWPTYPSTPGQAWPARYVRANITEWPYEDFGGRVSATVASA